MLKAMKTMKEDFIKMINDNNNIPAQLLFKAIELKPGLTHLVAFLFGGILIPALFYEHLFLVIILCMVAQIFLIRKLYFVARDALIEEEKRKSSNE